MKSTERFTERARDYACARPAYPEQALDALFEGLGDVAGLTVVDLGAGTGISSRQLAARGADVIAVEPNAGMRAQAADSPCVSWRDGVAEGTGLCDASADLVVAFQAFHWFDAPRALKEIARILRRPGRAALVYNERDETDAFTGEYGELVRRYATDETERRRADGRSAFQAYPAWKTLRTVELHNEQGLDRAGIHARAGSTSYLPREGSAAAQLHAEIDRLFDAHCAAGSVTMCLRTVLTIADL